MAQFRLPSTKKNIRAFLGSVGYYRRFIQGFTNQSALLTPTTSKLALGRVDWTKEMLAALHVLRKSLCDHCILTIPCLSDVYEMHTDASGIGIGAVLNVLRDSKEHPVAFFSRQLRGPEKKN